LWRNNNKMKHTHLNKVLGRNLSIKLVKKFNKFLRKLAYKSHSLQRNLEWNDSPPEWFDHFIDLYYQWPKGKNVYWLERGVFNLLTIKQNGALLEICCGDGFNAKYFYSVKAGSILAVDFDPSAIDHAKTNNSSEKIKYELRDIRNGLPEGKFDNIIWDAAIEHFTPDEIHRVIKDAKIHLNSGGVLSGYTLKEKQGVEKQLPHHEYEFKSKADLENFFKPYFSNIKILETVYPDRHNFYFFASDKSGNLTNGL